MFHVQLYLLLCWVPRVTWLKCSSFDLIHVHTTKKRNALTICHCFRDVAIHIIAVSKTLHSSNQNAVMVPLLMLLKKYRKCSFWKLNNRVWRWVLSWRPRCTKPDTGMRSTFWMVTMDAQDEHHVINMVPETTACHVYPLMIDYTNLWLTLAISFHGNFLTRLEETSLWTKLQ